MRLKRFKREFLINDLKNKLIFKLLYKNSSCHMFSDPFLCYASGFQFYEVENVPFPAKENKHEMGGMDGQILPSPGHRLITRNNGPSLCGDKGHMKTKSLMFLTGM